MMRIDKDISNLPTERMKRNFNRRRWSDSPTSLKSANLASVGARMSADHDLTQSLHDLSEPILKPVSMVSSASQNNLSTLTLQSEQSLEAHSQSRDSGFTKSASCLSLNRSRQKYKHVESKVKKYVQDIKDAEALRKKSMSTGHVNTCVSSLRASVKPYNQTKENVNELIGKMKADLDDKDAMIRALQGSYDDLLLKYAEAEIKIDQLRLRSVHRSGAYSQQSHVYDPSRFEFKAFPNPQKDFINLKKTSFCTDSKLLSPKDTMEESVVFDGSCSPSLSESITLSSPSQFDQSKFSEKKSRPKEVVISVPLGPIQKLYSTSVRLDRVLTPLGPCSQKSSKSTPSLPETQSSRLPIVNETHAEEEGRSEIAKSNLNYTTAETNVYHMTTDTGIGDCVHSATDENEGKKTARPEIKLISNIPDEDAISKVQRWRDSLPEDITERTKQKKIRSKRPTSRKTVGVQTFQEYLYNERPTNFSLMKNLNASDYAESQYTDCDTSELSRRKSWIPNAPQTRRGQMMFRSRSVGRLNRHHCPGECKTCGTAVVGNQDPEGISVCTSSRRKVRPDFESPSSRIARCPRVASGHVTRAVLLDMLLNAQTAHSCCCCCQHVWRRRQSSFSSKDEPSQEKNGENALQQCLAEIQIIARELDAKLAASHASLLNLSCRKKN